MPRDVGDVADPATVVDHDEVDQVAADLAARQRGAAELESPDARVDARHQQLVDLVRQLDLRVRAKVA